MKPWFYALASALFLSALPACYPAGQRPGSTDESRQELLELENHWLAAENDPNRVETILASDFLHVVPAGIITKEEQLTFMRKHPVAEATARRHFEDMHVRIYGTVGIVNGMVVETGRGAPRKTLFTDVFAHRGGKWQAVNAQELPAAEAMH